MYIQLPQTTKQEINVLVYNMCNRSILYTYTHKGNEFTKHLCLEEKE